MVLDALPVTVNGKVDRGALPAPDFAGHRRAGAPATPAEEVCAGCSRRCWGCDRVGAEDGFFDLGGDSIMSMQLVARARRAGLVFTPREVFEQKTPAGWPAARPAGPAGGGMVEESVPGWCRLTPVMCWLAERGGPVGRFSQSVVVVVPPGRGWAAGGRWGRSLVFMMCCGPGWSSRRRVAASW